MAAKPETNFMGRVHRKLDPAIYHMKNNNPYLGGVPDVWYSGRAGDLWVEYKYVDPLPVSVPIRPAKLLSALQTEWLNERHKEGRNVAVIIGCKAGGAILRDLQWQHDLNVDYFKSLILSPTQLAEWVFKQVEAST